MRLVLGALVALLVSADNEGVRVITGDLQGTVLLPCPCSLNLDKEFKWQKDEPRASLLLKYTNHKPVFEGSYQGRATIFQPEKSHNCSVLLANITADDQGKYRCSFRNQQRYMKEFVYLNISARYTLCQTNDSNVTVFHCNASGPHKDAVIEWRSDGQLLTDSAQTRITDSIAVDVPSGRYHFRSKLNAKLKSTPTCNITAKGLSTVVDHDHCPPTGGGPQPRTGPESTWHHYLITIPFIVALGFCLFLWWHRKSFYRKVRKEITE